jgi:hypothetical protein
MKLAVPHGDRLGTGLILYLYHTFEAEGSGKRTEHTGKQRASTLRSRPPAQIALVRLGLTFLALAAILLTSLGTVGIRTGAQN